jgi:hypothetical protein
MASGCREISLLRCGIPRNRGEVLFGRRSCFGILSEGFYHAVDCLGAGTAGLFIEDELRCVYVRFRRGASVTALRMVARSRRNGGRVMRQSVRANSSSTHWKNATSSARMQPIAQMSMSTPDLAAPKRSSGERSDPGRRRGGRSGQPGVAYFDDGGRSDEDVARLQKLTADAGAIHVFQRAAWLLGDTALADVEAVERLRIDTGTRPEAGVRRCDLLRAKSTRLPCPPNRARIHFGGRCSSGHTSMHRCAQETE